MIWKSIKNQLCSKNNVVGTVPHVRPTNKPYLDNVRAGEDSLQRPLRELTAIVFHFAGQHCTLLGFQRTSPIKLLNEKIDYVR
jgi:hypothetical protein